MDLNNMKTSAGNKKYVITNSIIQHRKIASFDMALRPLCLNVIEEIPGNQLHLYHLNSNVIRLWNGKRKKYIANRRRLKYENFDVPWRNALYYGVIEFWGRFKEIF